VYWQIFTCAVSQFQVDLCDAAITAMFVCERQRCCVKSLLLDCELGAATELLLACKCIEIQHDFWGHIKFKMCVGMGTEKVPSVLL